MTKPQIKIINSQTGEEIIRDFNSEELTQFKNDELLTKTEKEAAKAKAAQRQEILDRLGLTSEEAALLLS
jgi:hypothetical protein